MDEAPVRGMSRELERPRQILAAEMQPSKACAFLFAWEKLTYQDSRQQSARYQINILTGARCAKLSPPQIFHRGGNDEDRQLFSAPPLSSNLLLHIFSFSDAPLMTGNFLGSCVSLFAEYWSRHSKQKIPAQTQFYSTILDPTER